MNSNKIPRCGHLLLRLVQVNQGPSLSYKEMVEGLEIWGARKIKKSFDETGFASNLGPLISSIFDKFPDVVITSITAKPFFLWKSLFPRICSKF